MAITSFDMSFDKIRTTSSGSAYSSKRSNSSRFLKLKYTPDSSLSSATSKCGKPKKKTIHTSPYLVGDRVQLFSRVVEKRFVHKTDIVSSFPLAANLYKASSDDFKPPAKVNKKVKKSVLTLPNDPAPVPQVCTVSDMNDSEYQEKIDEDRKRKVIKKRPPILNNRKIRGREKDFEFYDRDAQYCSQLNIDLDCSSTDMMKNFNGDGKRMSNRHKKMPTFNKNQTASENLSDVWAVLRNMNKCQFKPSPPMSEESSPVPVKKVQKRPNKTNRKDTRVIKTCRTQEFAFISSYELDKKSPLDSFSPSSSIDRITVIDNKDNFSKICKEFEKRLRGTRDFHKDINNNKNLIQKNKTQGKIPKSNFRALGNTGPKENKQTVPLKKKKKKCLEPVEQSKSEITSSSGNRDSLIGVKTLQLNDNSDILSCRTEDLNAFSTEVNFDRYDSSGSNKDELSFKESEQASRNDVAVLNKELEPFTAKIPKEFDSPQRKPRLVTTMPSSSLIPKLTQAEIKRKLASNKFPIVVLGKDQVSSSIKVMDYDPPQFDGLDDHIWPFMIEWSPKPSDDTKLPTYNIVGNTCQAHVLDDNSENQIKSKTRKANTVESVYRPTAWREKKQANNDFNKKKVKITPTPNSELAVKLLHCSKKQKSIIQLKDKMLNFLYKKSSKLNLKNDSNVSEECHRSLTPTDNNNSAIAANENENKVPAITDNQLKPVNALALNDLPKKGLPPIVSSNIKSHTYKYPWAKAKWASDFIENVMKKIRSGVYYTQDRKDISQRREIDLKEASVQAGSILSSADSTQTNDSEKDLTKAGTNKITKKNLINIPGFNNAPPLLEIKTLNMNQIAVKHCVTNVMVQFDITVPAKSTPSATSLSKTLTLTPVAITDSYTKVYKSKATIFNAMLPAELCSILPKLMSNIVDSSKSSTEDSAPCPEITDSWLSTITELTRNETGGSLSKITSCYTHLSSETDHILEGRFSNKHHKKPIPNKVHLEIKYDRCLVTEMLPKVFLKYEACPLVQELYNSQHINSQTPLLQSTDLCKPDIQDHTICSSAEIYTGSTKIIDHTNCTPGKIYTGTNNIINHTICTPEEIYTGSNKILNHTICASGEIYTGTNKIIAKPSPAFKPDNLVGMIESMMRKYNLQINHNLSTYFDMLKMQYDGQNIEINMLMTNNSGVQKTVSVTVNNLNVDSLCEAFPITKIHENNLLNGNNTLECIEYINTSTALTLARKSQTMKLTQEVTFNKINRRKGFYKLYRKCKTSNMPSGRKFNNTPLNKIATLDDFYRILGSRKIFSSVLDGNVSKKILPSLLEMKNWISEINPKQALLILLLNNKKDTQNLVRFRPIILQGIAVNRITRATELDMEIEVIDRENLNKEFEGITYLPESVKDYENLLEELYWIAKTTASDFKRPFDESSERLLKSLLQKRKKLNPSYLRVMARYVGLGLVKTPT